LIDDAPDDHGQRVAHPGLGGFGVEGAVEADVFGQGEQGGGSAVFLGGEDFEGGGVVFGQNVVAEGGLDVEQGAQRQAGEAAMLLVFDFTVGRITKGRAQDADGVLAVALDFEMDRRASFDGSKYTELINHSNEYYFRCMATFEMTI
jgi:hypothetical protein